MCRKQLLKKERRKTPKNNNNREQKLELLSFVLSRSGTKSILISKCYCNVGLAKILLFCAFKTPPIYITTSTTGSTMTVT
jgi:hypothetical protein